MITKTRTPLRYPGGKSILKDYFCQYINCNFNQLPVYVEAYCGGAGAAIDLLLSNKVSKIVLNDADFSVYSFWHTLKNHSNDLIELINNTEVSLKEWEKQKSVYRDSRSNVNSDMTKLGFATFYLNRCNRSGILKAGPIGGSSEKAQSNAAYKIGARFNKPELVERIKEIARHNERIEVLNFDAMDLLDYIILNGSVDDLENTFIYLDPPYFVQGSGLYMNYYKEKDHIALRDKLKNLPQLIKWLLSYDDVVDVRKLYSNFNQYSFNVSYNVQTSKGGSELLIPSEYSILPQTDILKKLSNKREIKLERIQ